MTGLVFLDIAIGVIFLILVFSLFAGAIQEAISAIFNLRAKSLREGIFRMLGNDQSEFDRFWNTPLIDSLKGPTWAILRIFDGHSEPGKRNPSEIPHDTFVKSILYRVREELREEVKDISPSDAAAFLAELRKRGQAERNKQKAWYEKMAAARAKGETLPVPGPGETPNPLILRIDTVLEGVADKAEDIEAALGRWYDETRDRFAGWYIRRTQAILFIIGLWLAVMTNTDPIGYGIELYRNDALRQKVVLMAEEAAAVEDLEDLAEAIAPKATYAEDDAEKLKDIWQDIQNRTQALSDKLNGIDASTGWSYCGDKGLTFRCFGQTVYFFSDARKRWAAEAKEAGTVFTYAPLGWLLLALGVMLGAQFWMDLLKRFVSIRSAGAALVGQPQRPKAPPQEQAETGTQAQPKA